MCVCECITGGVQNQVSANIEGLAFYILTSGSISCC